MFSFFDLLFKLLSHYYFLRFSSHCHGKLSKEFYILGNFVMSDVSFAMIKNLPACNFVVLKTLDFDQSSNFLSEDWIRHSNDLHILNSVHLVDKILDFFRIYILPSSNDHIFFPSNYRKITLLVNNADIPRFHPSILDRLSSGTCVTPILKHNMPSFGQVLSRLTYFNYLPILVDYFGLEPIQDFANCCCLFHHAI